MQMWHTRSCGDSSRDVLCGSIWPSSISTNASSVRPTCTDGHTCGPRTYRWHSCEKAWRPCTAAPMRRTVHHRSCRGSCSERRQVVRRWNGQKNTPSGVDWVCGAWAPNLKRLVRSSSGRHTIDRDSAIVIVQTVHSAPLRAGLGFVRLTLVHPLDNLCGRIEQPVCLGSTGEALGRLGEPRNSTLGTKVMPT